MHRVRCVDGVLHLLEYIDDAPGETLREMVVIVTERLPHSVDLYKYISLKYAQLTYYSLPIHFHPTHHNHCSSFSSHTLLTQFILLTFEDLDIQDLDIHIYSDIIAYY